MTETVLLIFLAGSLQIIGTALTGLFAVKGLSVEKSKNTFVNGKLISHVNIEPRYLTLAKIGIVALLLGIFFSALSSIMQLA